MRDLRDAMDKMINSEIASNRVVGANVLLLREDKEIFFKSYGMADKEKQLPMTRDRIFRLFSMSKPITSTAVMMLFERGEIDLYMPVSRFLGGFKHQCVLEGGRRIPVEREVTIRDLLNMTSGICYPGETYEAEAYMAKELGGLLDNPGNISTLEFGNVIGQCPLAFQPGSKWLYGFSADILGCIVEAVTGKRYGEFLKEELFKPLGMRDTGFAVPEEKRDRLAQIYAQDYDGTGKVIGMVPFTERFLGIGDYRCGMFESGGAGLTSTIDDYARFAGMLASGGIYDGRRILSSATVSFMTTAQLNEVQQQSVEWESLRGYSYGNLMRIHTNKAVSAANVPVGEFGWDGWTGNYFSVNPTDNSIMLYFIQRAHSGTDEATRRIRAISYSMMADK